MNAAEGINGYTHTKSIARRVTMEQGEFQLTGPAYIAPKDFRQAQKARQGPAAGSHYEMAVAAYGTEGGSRD